VRRALIAGALIGAAAALKYSNAIYALAALPLTLAMPGLSGLARVRACLAYMAGGPRRSPCWQVRGSHC